EHIAEPARALSLAYVDPVPIARRAARRLHVVIVIVEHKFGPKLDDTLTVKQAGYVAFARCVGSALQSDGKCSARDASGGFDCRGRGRGDRGLLQADHLAEEIRYRALDTHRHLGVGDIREDYLVGESGSGAPGRAQGRIRIGRIGNAVQTSVPVDVVYRGS